MSGDSWDSWEEAPAQYPPNDRAAQRNITDGYIDLLRYLRPAQRRGLTARLANGYYEGWRPSREELADLIAVELGLLTWAESVERGQARRAGHQPVSVIGRIKARAH